MVALSALSACGGSNPLSSILGGPSGAPSPPTGWTLWFSPGASLGAGPSFSFPTWVSSCPGPTGFNQTCPSVHYLVNKASPPLIGKTITLKFTVTGSNPAWNYANIEQDGNTCTSPASVRFFLQRSGDDWSGTGSYTYYRWWSSANVPLAIGTYTLTVPIAETTDWTDVSGDHSAGAGSFDLAANNASAIGMTFGGGCFYGHGVDLKGGSATFTVNSFTVQ